MGFAALNPSYGLDPEGFRKHIAVEAEKWAKVIKMQGIKLIN